MNLFVQMKELSYCKWLMICGPFFFNQDKLNVEFIGVGSAILEDKFTQLWGSTLKVFIDKHSLELSFSL